MQTGFFPIPGFPGMTVTSVDCLTVIHFSEVSLFSKLKGRCAGCVSPVSRRPTCPAPVTPSGTGGSLPHDLSTQREAWGHRTGDFFSGVRAN